MKALWLRIAVVFLFCFASISVSAKKLLIHMDEQQADHLRAYGLTYFALQKGIEVEWLLNYRGGSFLLDYYEFVEKQGNLLGVSLTAVSDAQLQQLREVIANNNMNSVLLEKAPKIAVYAPPEIDPWDDAVILIMTYAKIPYTRIWDKEVLSGRLSEYDWLHLHHEDFTGQYGKFYRAFRNAAWYQKRVLRFRKAAAEAGFATVAEHKGAVVSKLLRYVTDGGFLFAMCSAVDSLDIALAAEGVDIIEAEIDGTPIDSNYRAKLDFNRTFAFTNFVLKPNALIYEFSNIDVSNYNNSEQSGKEDFVLFDFSAKYDPVPTMLTQNHMRQIKGFFGQTTSFLNSVIKDEVIIMGRIKGEARSKYIHGNRGKGTFSFLGGHDPEDYSHLVGEEPTNLELHKQSPGYRLILNNILFPAAKKYKQKT